MTKIRLPGQIETDFILLTRRDQVVLLCTALIYVLKTYSFYDIASEYAIIICPYRRVTTLQIWAQNS